MSHFVGDTLKPNFTLFQDGLCSWQFLGKRILRPLAIVKSKTYSHRLTAADCGW